VKTPETGLLLLSEAIGGRKDQSFDMSGSVVRDRTFIIA
jgi:hypothetical protein